MLERSYVCKQLKSKCFAINGEHACSWTSWSWQQGFRMHTMGTWEVTQEEDTAKNF
jgi:hypothetical protein